MNFGEIILAVIVVWSLLSIVVSLAVGGMAKARDTGAPTPLDHNVMTGRLAPGSVSPAPRGGDEGTRAVL